MASLRPRRRILSPSTTAGAAPGPIDPRLLSSDSLREDMQAEEQAYNQQDRDLAMQQRRQEVESQRAQRDQQQAVEQQQRDRSRMSNAATARELDTLGVARTTDANNRPVAELDPLTGRPRYSKMETPVQYDQTGNPFKVERQEDGSWKQVNPDAGADIGPNPDNPDDKALYRKNKLKPWDYIDPEAGLIDSDPAVKRASANRLLGLERKTLDQEERVLRAELTKPEYDAPTQKELERATAMMQAGAAGDDDKKIIERAKRIDEKKKRLSDIAVSSADLAGVTDDEYAARRIASMPTDKIKATHDQVFQAKSQGIQALRASLDQEEQGLAKEWQDFLPKTKGFRPEEEATIREQMAAFSLRRQVLDAKKGAFSQSQSEFEKMQQDLHTQAVQSAAVGTPVTDKPVTPEAAKQAAPADIPFEQAVTEAKSGALPWSKIIEGQKTRLGYMQADGSMPEASKVMDRWVRVLGSMDPSNPEDEQGIRQAQQMAAQEVNAAAEKDSAAIAAKKEEGRAAAALLTNPGSQDAIAENYSKEERKALEEKANEYRRATFDSTWEEGAKPAHYSKEYGELNVNPALLFKPEEYAKAVESVDAPPLAKEKAMQSMVLQQQQQAKPLYRAFAENPMTSKAFMASKAKTVARMGAPSITEGSNPAEIATAVSDFINSPDFSPNWNQVVLGASQGMANLKQSVYGLGSFFGSDIAQKEGEQQMKRQQMEGAAAAVGGGSELLGGIAQGGTSLIPSIGAGIVTGGAGFGVQGAMLANSLVAGAQSTGATMIEAEKAGMSPLGARLTALGSGAITAGLTQLGGTTGTEAILGKLFAKGAGEVTMSAVRPALSKAIVEKVKGYGIDGLKEALLEEMPDQFFQNVLKSVTYKPGQDVTEGLLDTGIVSFILGAGVNAATDVAGGTKEKFNATKLAKDYTVRMELGQRIAANTSPEVVTATLQGTPMEARTPEALETLSGFDARIADGREQLEKAATPSQKLYSTRQLAQAYGQRLEFVNTLRNDLEQSFMDAAVSEIDSAEGPVADPQLGMGSLTPAPSAEFQQDKVRAKALLAVATGKIETLDTASLASIDLGRDDKGAIVAAKGKTTSPDGVPRVILQDGQPVITQGAIDRITDLFPATAPLIGQSEGERRAAIMVEAAKATAEKDKKAENPDVPKAETVENKPVAKAENATVKASQKAPQQEFSVTLEGREEPVSIIAANPEEATAKAATKFKAMVQEVDLIGPAPVAAEVKAEAPVAPKAEKPKANLPPVDITPVSIAKNILNARSKVGNAAPATPEQRQRYVKSAKALSDEINKWKQAFPGGIKEAQGTGMGGLQVLQTGNKPTLLLDFTALSESFDALEENSGAWVERAIQEEVIHSVAVALEADGKLDLAGIYRSLPKSIQEQVRKAYPEGAERNMGHEFFRMWIQQRLAGKKAGKGQPVLTEQTMPPSVLSQLADALNTLLAYFRDLAKTLKKQKASDETIARVTAAGDMIEAGVRALQPEPRKVKTKPVRLRSRFRPDAELYPGISAAISLQIAPKPPFSGESIASYNGSPKQSDYNTREAKDAVSRLYSPGSSVRPDTAAQAFAEAIGEDPNGFTEFDMWAVVRGELELLDGARGKAAEQDDRMADLERQVLAFEAAIEDGKVKVEAKDLEVGEVLMIEGDRVVVKSIDTGNNGQVTGITLQDGKKFGMQEISPDKVMFVERYIANDPDWSVEENPAPVAETPVASVPESETPDLNTVNQDMGVFKDIAGMAKEAIALRSDPQRWLDTLVKNAEQDLENSGRYRINGNPGGRSYLKRDGDGVAAVAEDEGRIISYPSLREALADIYRIAPASWVIVDKETGEAVFETYQSSVAGKINTKKYKVIPIQEYLGSINGGTPSEQNNQTTIPPAQPEAQAQETADAAPAPEVTADGQRDMFAGRADEPFNLTPESPGEETARLAREAAVESKRKADAAEKAKREAEAATPELPIQEVPAQPEPVEPISGIKPLQDFISRLVKGDITAQQVKDAWESYKANEEAIRAEFGKMTMKALEKYQGFRRPDNKAEAVRSAIDAHESYFNPTDMLQYGGSITGLLVGDSKRVAMDKVVAQWTDETIQKQAQDRRDAIAAKEKALTNPETKDEWEKFVYRKGRQALTEAEVKEILKMRSGSDRNDAVMKKGENELTSEQLAAYDEIRGIDRKKQKEDAEARKATVRAVNAGSESEIIETQHTKTKEPLFVVRLADRVEKDVYTSLLGAAKKLGGYYSSYRGGGAVPGFQFKSRDVAEQFQQVTKGQSVDRTEAVEEKRAEKKNASAERMVKMADALDVRADEILNADRKTNTYKRATEAAYAEKNARGMKAMAQTMRNLAAAMESGKATHLDGVKAKTHVETLESLTKRAKDAAERKLNLSYLERQKIDGEKPTAEQMSEAVYPAPYLTKGDILGLVARGEKTAGAKLIAARVAKIPMNDDGAVTLRDSTDIANVKELLQKLGDKAFDWKFESYDRVQAMGLTDLPSLRAALREYLEYSGTAAKADPVKQMERALIGKNLPGFFPTPPAVIDQMLSEAGGLSGKRVLEPSAGKGDIAEAAIAAGAEVDAIEMQSGLRDILEAKGIKVVGNDVTDFTPEEAYDVVLMNPPFENGQDMEHVRLAFEMLKPGGRLVAVMSEGPFGRQDKKSAEFRDWLEQSGGISEKLPEGSFKSAFRSTGVATRLVVVDKPEATVTDANKAYRDEQDAIREELLQDLGVSDKAALDAYSPEGSVFKTGRYWSYRTFQGNTSQGNYDTKKEAIEAARSHIKLKLDQFDNPGGYRDIVSVRASKDLALIEKYMREGMSEMEAGKKVRESRQPLSAQSPATALKDAGYMAAVEAGDIAKAQAMVDEAAKAAGYNVGTAWHGTDKEFTVFKRVNSDKPGLRFPHTPLGFFFSTTADVSTIHGKRQIKAYLKLENPGEISYKDLFNIQSEKSAEQTRFNAENAGKDGLIITRENSPYFYIAFNSNQIKSADPITRDESGNVIPLSQRFNPDSDSILYAQSPAALLRAARVNTTEIDKRSAQASFEQPGNRTIIDPERSLGAGVNSPGDPEILATSSLYAEEVTAETVAQWDAAAREKIANDYEATVNQVMKPGFKGDTLSPELTRAAQMIVEIESRKPMDAKQRQKMQALVWSYRLTGTEAGRQLASRKDPFKTKQERHREAISKSIFMPPPGVREALEKAETKGEKDRLLAEDAKRIDEIVKALAKMGVTIEDVLNGDRMLVARRKDIVKSSIAGAMDSKESAAVLDALDGTTSFRDIADKHGMSEGQAVKAFDTAKAAFEKELRRRIAMAQQAKGLNAPLNAQPVTSDPWVEFDFGGIAEMSAAEQEMAIARIMQRVGFFPKEQQGKRKTVKRKVVPPVVPTGARMSAEDYLKLPMPRDIRGTQATLPGPLLEPAPTMEVSVIKGSDLTDIKDVYKMMRISSAAGSNAFDMMREYWINNLLSGPVTQIKNIGSNVLFGSWNLVASRAMQATFNLAVRNDESASFGEFKEIWKSMGPAWKRGIQIMGLNWQTEEDQFDHLLMNEQIQLMDTGPAGEYRRVAISERPLEQAFGKVGGVMDNALDKTFNNPLTKALTPKYFEGKNLNPVRGRVFRTPGRCLAAMDGFCKGLFGTMEAGAHAYRIAKAEGLKPGTDAFKERIDVLLYTPGSKAWYEAAAQAKENTFQTDLDPSKNGLDKFPKWIAGIPGRLEKDKASANPAIRSLAYFKHFASMLLFPFTKTPYNVYREGFRRSPLGSLYLGYQVGKGLYSIKNGGITSEAKAQFIKTLSEQVFAWTALMIFRNAFEGDDDDRDKWLLITGSAPGTQGGRDLQERAFGGPYVVKIGKTVVPYGWLEPAAVVLGTTADFMRSAKSGGDNWDKTAAFGNSVKRGAFDKTFLAGLKSMAQLMNLDEQGGGTPIGKRMQRAFLQGIVPNILRQPMRNADSRVPDSTGANWLYDAVPLPWMVEGKVNAGSGQEKEKTGNTLTRLLLPSAIKPDENLSESDKMLLQWNQKFPDKAWAPAPPSRTIEVDGKRVELNTASYNFYATHSGTVANKLLKGRKFLVTEDDLEIIKEAQADARKASRDILKRKGIAAIGTVKED